MEPGDTHGRDRPPGLLCCKSCKLPFTERRTESIATVTPDSLQRSMSEEKDAEEELASEKCIREEL